MYVLPAARPLPFYALIAITMLGQMGPSAPQCLRAASSPAFYQQHSPRLPGEQHTLVGCLLTGSESMLQTSGLKLLVFLFVTGYRAACNSQGPPNQFSAFIFN